MTAGPHIGAAVDLGSNSVHLLVAAVAGHQLRPLVDESAFLGLGAAVDSGSRLGGERTAALVDQLRTDATTARDLGATRIAFLGTEPIRRAADAPSICAVVERETGVPVHVLSHEEEGYLTLVGVTEGRPVRHETLVLDIGGGSSEFVAVGPRTRARAAGLRTGSNRLTRLIDPADPPSPVDIERLRTAARAALEDALEDRPSELIAVGGTASNLLKVTASGVGDRLVTRDRLAEALTNVTATSATETSARWGVNPTRARLLPAGTVLVEAILDRYGLDALTISDAGLREGAILAMDHAGHAWRDRLADLAHGWRS